MIPMPNKRMVNCGNSTVTDDPNCVNASLPDSSSSVKIFLILFFIVGLLVIILFFISRIRNILRTKHYPQNYNFEHHRMSEMQQTTTDRRRSSTNGGGGTSRRERLQQRQLERRRSSRLSRLNSFLFWRHPANSQLSPSSIDGTGARRHTIAMTDTSMESEIERNRTHNGEPTNEQYLQLFNQILRSELTTSTSGNGATSGGINSIIMHPWFQPYLHLLENYPRNLYGHRPTMNGFPGANDAWLVEVDQPPPSYLDVMINKDQYVEPKDDASTVTTQQQDTNSVIGLSVSTPTTPTSLELPPPSYSQLSKMV